MDVEWWRRLRRWSVVPAGLVAVLAVPPVAAAQATGTLELVDAVAVSSTLPPDAGQAVSFAGSFAGTGTSAVAVGAPRAAAGDKARAGLVIVRAGERELQIAGPSANALAGSSLANLGDVNNDQLDDLLIGAPGADGTGAAYVVFGSSTDNGPLDLADPGPRVIRLTGVTAGDRAGAAVAAIGDLDADGVREAAIGVPRANAPGRPDAGAIVVVYSRGLTRSASRSLGDASMLTVLGSAAGAQAGAAMASAPDGNADGLPELLVGAPGGAGAAYVVWGRRQPGLVDLGVADGSARAILGAPGERAGSAVASLDINADGTADYAIGAPLAGPPGRARAGVVYVVYGSASLDPVFLPAGAGLRIDGAARGDRLGTALAAAGDLDGDGRGDLLVGAPATTVGSGAGSAFAVFGRDTPLDLAIPGRGAVRLAGRSASAHAGRAVDAAGGRLLVGGRQAAWLVPELKRLPDLGAGTPALRRCPTPVSDVEVLISDARQMHTRDPTGLRGQALQLLVGTPRQTDLTVGALEFGTAAREIFPPLTVGPAGLGTELPVVQHLAEERLRGDGGDRNLIGALDVARQLNPRRDAMILITDGTQNAPRMPVPTPDVPTYVIALGVRRATQPGLALRKLAEDSGGDWFFVGSANELQSAIASIDGRLTCAEQLAVSVGNATPPASQADPTPAAVQVGVGRAVNFTSAPLTAPSKKPRLKSITLVVNWNNKKAKFSVRRIDLLRRGKTSLRISSRTIRRALRRHGHPIVLHGVTIRARRGKTFVSLRLSGGLRADGSSAFASFLGVSNMRSRVSHGGGKGRVSAVAYQHWGPH